MSSVSCRAERWAYSPLHACSSLAWFHSLLLTRLLPLLAPPSSGGICLHALRVQIAGTWKSKKDDGCGFTIAPPCLCYTWVCYTYKGCPFSGTMAWTCGDGCIVGPCIQINYKDADTVSHTWLGMCPEENVRGGGPPAAAEMAR